MAELRTEFAFSVPHPPALAKVRLVAPALSHPETPVIDKELLEILACPETHQHLAMASADQVAALNAKIDAGDMANVGGESVADKIEAGLVREDAQIVYPIRDSIPVLLIHEGLAL